MHNRSNTVPPENRSSGSRTADGSTSIHAIILTLNEDKHIARCIESIAQHCATVTVVDSGSTDRTVQIAEELGANVITNAWVNYATQMNFAIDTLSDLGGWLLRIDADETLDADSLISPDKAVACAGGNTDGLLVQRRIHFLGRRIRHGAIEPSWQLRLWRNGKGRCEQRWMDEHIEIPGLAVHSGLILADINLNSVTWWTNKHNWYASREAIDLLHLKYLAASARGVSTSSANQQAKKRRFLKERVYSVVPAGIRPLIYFLYRYVLRLGFLDGREGWYFHALQGFWYRTLVDAKINEIEQYARRNGIGLAEAIFACTGIDPSALDT